MSSPEAGLWRRLDDSGMPLLVARLLLGGVFVSMSLAKLDNPVAFLKLVRQYDLAPASVPWLLNSLAIVIPWLELWLGLLLILGVALRGVALTLLLLLVVFSTAIALRALGIAQSDGIPYCQVAFDCGCGTGVVRACIKLPENLGLMLLAGLILVSRSSRLCLWARPLGRRPGLVESAPRQPPHAREPSP